MTDELIRIQLRNDTAANWASANPILAQGEVGIEWDTHLWKLGDGVTAYNSLPYNAGIQSLTGGSGITITDVNNDLTISVTPEMFDAYGSAITAQNNSEAYTAAYALLKTGGVMSGAIAMGSNKITGLANGTASTDAAAFGQIPTTLPPTGSAGGVLSGTYPNPSLAASPALTGVPTAPTASALTNSTQIATTAYTDSAVAAALSTIPAQPVCQYGTAGPLSSNTYSNGTSGIGATLTATANGVLTIDGQTPGINVRILVQNESTQSHNGIYTVTNTGGVSTPWVLTRATDFDTSTQMSVATLVPIDAEGLTPGSTNNNKIFLSMTNSSFIVGTTTITFVQIGGTYSAGTGLTLSGNQFSVTPNTYDTYGAAATETTRALAAEALLAPLASPALTGTPMAPTQTTGDNTTKIATDQFVTTAVAIETTRAEGVESTLATQTALSAEISRAETAEATKQSVQVLVPGNLGATYTVNLSNTINQKVIVYGTLTANCTITISNRAAGCEILLNVVQGGSGNYTVSISDGTTTDLISNINGSVGSSTTIQIDCPNSTDLYVNVITASALPTNFTSIQSVAPVVSTSTTVAINTLTPVNSSAGALTQTLPTGQPAGSLIAIQNVNTATTLSTALTTGSPITSLPVNALPYALVTGVVVPTTYGTNTQNWTIASPGAPAGATSIPVNSQTPNYAYPATTTTVTPPLNIVTVSGSIRDVNGSVTLKLPDETILLEADSSYSWWPIASHKTLSSLDSRYNPNVIQAGNLGSTNTLTLSVTPQWLIGTLTTNLALTVNNLVSGASAYLLLTQNSTGGYTLTINSTPVTIPTTPSTSFIVELRTDGTNIYVA